MTAGCEATPLPESAFCISDGSGSTARRRDPAAGHGFAEGWSEPGRFSLPASSTLRSAAARLLGPGPCCCCPCSGCLCLFPVLQLCSVGLCSALLLEVPSTALPCGKRCFPRASIAALLTWKHPSPLVLLHLGPALSQQLVLPGNTLGQLWTTSSPTWNCAASGSLGIKQTLQSTSVTAWEEREHCCHLLCCLTSSSQIRSGRSKEMANSARVCFFVMEGTSQARKNIPSLWLHSLLVAFRAESENSSLYIQSLLIQF